jgi:hypothetical protein
MSKEPKNHTVVFSAWQQGDNYGTMESVTKYGDCPSPMYLPGAALCEDTIEEWRSWWHWRVDRLADKAVEMERDRLRLLSHKQPMVGL